MRCLLYYLDMEQLRNILEKFNAIGDLNALKRDGRDFSFSDIHHLLVETHKNLQEIIQNPDFWDLLPENIRNNSVNPFTQIEQLAEQIKNFNPAQGANQNTRDSIAQQVRNYYSELYNPVFLPLEVFRVKKALSAGNIQELSKEAQDTLIEIKKQKGQSQELIAAIKETAAVGGTTKFAGIFSEEAKRHKIAARWWLAVSTIAAILIVIFLYDTFTKLTDALRSITVGGDSVSITLQLFFAKILILSFLSVVFYQIVKNYNANMHLSIINRHRENSLKTFQAFVDSTNDSKTKDIILVQSTQTIFAAGDTGYVSSSDYSPSFDAMKIIEQSQK